MTRLALIHQRFASETGVERVAEAALEALLERGVAMSLYTRAWPRTRLQLIEPVLCNPFYIGQVWRDWSFGRSVCRLIAKAPPELVESHERVLCCDIYRADEGVHQVRLEEYWRDAPAYRRWLAVSNPYHRYLVAMEQRLFTTPSLRAVICGSKMVRDEIRERFGLPDAKLSVIYNAVDSDVFSPALRQHREAVRRKLGVPDAATVFLIVGSDYQRNGVAAAIAALPRLSQDTYLFIVGRDNARARYKRLVSRLGVARRVALLGEQGDVKPFYGAADAFVLPTPYDPCPNAVLEAMACGLPVVTTPKCGVAELVREHGAGFVGPAHDIDQLASHMMRLTDARTRETLGGCAREAVLPLTPAAITLQLVLLYRDLLAAAHAGKLARG